MEPPVRVVFTFAEYDGKNICAAEIPVIDIAERSCYYKGAGKVKGSYIRGGEADMLMTDYEMLNITREGISTLAMWTKKMQNF